MAKSKAKILVVDDNSGIRAALKVLLPLHFSQVELIPSPKELVTKMADFRPDVVLLDMNFHTDINTGNEGLFWLSEIKKRSPDTEVVPFRTDASQESEMTSPYLLTSGSYAPMDAGIFPK